MARQLVRVGTSSGTVEGFSRAGLNRWRAIPYARAPIGPLRLQAPQPPLPWRGVRHCHSFETCAFQDRKFTVLGVNRFQPMSEDCLTLNVVAPEGADADGPLPVLFFVHGGGYLLGSTATPLYDGASLARRGCVYVSANYRLGALGCFDLSSLSTSTQRIDGNLFLRDLVQALTWVRDNIAGFGGDPDRVTIFGESAGGHAVATLVATPAARNLFHGAISESPPAGMVRPAEVAARQARQFVAELSADPASAAQAVMTAPAPELVAALARVVTNSVRSAPGSFTVGASVDGDYLPLDPVAAMAAGQANPVPLVVGHNADETRLFSIFADYLPTTERTIEKLLTNTDPDTAARIRAAYPRYPRQRDCRDLGNDFAFGSLAWRIAEAHSAFHPTYRYRYDFAPRTLSAAGIGATHATELFAVFDVYRSRFGSLLTVAGDGTAARRVSDDIQSQWTAFARSGVPGDSWPAYGPPDRQVLVFDRRSRVEQDPDADRREVWADVNLTR